jgi:hypothetical protein
MPREMTPLVAADLSTFAKTLRVQWAERHERAVRPRIARAPTPARGPRDASLTEAADRALRQFDASGRLTRWPSKRALQVLVLWCLWLRFDAKRRYSEREVNEVLNAHHLFGDHCILRRELVELKLLTRTPGGAEYRKVAARPDAETIALLSALRARSA